MEHPDQIVVNEINLDDKHFYSIDEENKPLFNVDIVLGYLKNLQNDKFFVKELCRIVKEDRVIIH
jgi:hypothetical protein